MPFLKGIITNKIRQTIFSIRILSQKKYYFKPLSIYYYSVLLYTHGTRTEYIDIDIGINRKEE